MITKFDKPTAKALANEIAAALQGIAAKHGIAIDYNGGTVGDDVFTCRVRCKVTDEAAVAAKQKVDWNNYCHLFDLSAADYNAIVDVGAGKQVQLIGFDLGRTKCPIRVRDLQTMKIMLYPQMITKIVIAQRGTVS